MSPRAACRLDALGFEQVFDYMPGKADWLARGLPREGDKANEPRAIDYARHDAVTCRLHDTVGLVRDRIEASPYAFALALGSDRVLLGRLRRSALAGGDPDAITETIMEPGPSTVRADTSPERLREHLEHGNLTTAVITDPDGRLLGLIRRTELPSRG